MAKRRILAMVGVLLGVSAIILVVVLRESPAVVNVGSIDQLSYRRGEFLGQRLRVQGTMAPASLTKRESPCEYQFRLRGRLTELEVRYRRCVLPESFCVEPGWRGEVTIEGVLAQGGDHVEADLVLVKTGDIYADGPWDPCALP